MVLPRAGITLKSQILNMQLVSHDFATNDLVFHIFAPIFFAANFGFLRTANVANQTEVAPKQWTRAVTFEASLMKHLKSRKHHSKAFRKDAVELLLTGRTLHELAGELGVSAMTLYRWKEEYLMELANSPADTANLPPLKMQEELQRLRKENQKLKLHQEILKKAMGILSDLPPNGMP
jgi:transposase-like protein